MSHDASATWSGFNYQGKVALYHTLTLIKQKLINDNSYDFINYELILENHEDFDIKSPRGYESFHQVKAINQTAFSTYENALFAMLLQLDKPTHLSVTGYLHTWKPLRWNGNDVFTVKLKEIIKKVTDNHEDSPNDSIITKAFTNDLVTNKKIKILRQAIVEDSRLVDAIGVERILSQAYASNLDTVVTNRVKQYDYGDALACDISDIDLKVKGAITEINHVLNRPQNNEALDKIFCALLAKLDENIITKHSNLNANGETPIPFTEIIEVVIDDSLRDSDDAYLSSRFKLQFIKAFEEFIDDDELCPPDTARAYSDDESNLNVAMKILLNLSASDLWYYFKKLNPHIALDTKSTLDNALLTNIDNLRQYFFVIFSEMCKTKFIHKKSGQLILYKNGKKSYLPTTIGTQTKRNLVIKIMENSQAIASLFEVPTMITGCEYANEIECFSEEYSRLSGATVTDFYVNESPEEKETISEVSRKTRLIKVSTAIEEIANA